MIVLGLVARWQSPPSWKRSRKYHRLTHHILRMWPITEHSTRRGWKINVDRNTQGLLEISQTRATRQISKRGGSDLDRIKDSRFTTWLWPSLFLMALSKLCLPSNHQFPHLSDIYCDFILFFTLGSAGDQTQSLTNLSISFPKELPSWL